MAGVASLLIGLLMREDETLVFGQWNNARNIFFIKRGNKWFVHELGYGGDVSCFSLWICSSCSQN